jgi:hypothetical protein
MLKGEKFQHHKAAKSNLSESSSLKIECLAHIMKIKQKKTQIKSLKKVLRAQLRISV